MKNLKRVYNFVDQDESNPNETRVEEPYDTDFTEDETNDLNADTFLLEELNEQCAKNDAKWEKQKFIYKVTEFVLYSVSIVITLTSFWLSIWLLFFPEFKRVKSYMILLKKVLGISDFFTSISIFYFVIELCSFVLDTIKGFVLLKVFYIFRADPELKKNKKIKVNKNRNTHEEIHIVQTIANLKQRIVVRNRLKKIMRNLLIVECLINFYVLVFVILPKLVTAFYIEIKMDHYFNALNYDNHTIEQLLHVGAFGERNFTEVNAIRKKLNIVPNLDYKYECCYYDERSNLKNDDLFGCPNDENNNDCFYSQAFFYIRLITVVFFVTGIIKFITQSIFIVNLRYLIIHPLIKKNQINEENLNHKYKKYRYILDKSIRGDDSNTDIDDDDYNDTLSPKSMSDHSFDDINNNNNNTNMVSTRGLHAKNEPMHKMNPVQTERKFSDEDKMNKNSANLNNDRPKSNYNYGFNNFKRDIPPTHLSQHRKGSQPPAQHHNPHRNLRQTPNIQIVELPNERGSSDTSNNGSSKGFSSISQYKLNKRLSYI